MSDFTKQAFIFKDITSSRLIVVPINVITNVTLTKELLTIKTTDSYHQVTYQGNSLLGSSSALVTVLSKKDFRSAVLQLTNFDVGTLE